MCLLYRKTKKKSWEKCRGLFRSAAITSRTCFLMMQVACHSLLVLAVWKQTHAFDNSFGSGSSDECEVMMPEREMPNAFCCLCLFPFCLGMLIKLVMRMLGLWWGCARVLLDGCTHWNRAPSATGGFVTCEKLSCSMRQIEDKHHYSTFFLLLELFGISASVVSVLAKCHRSFGLSFVYSCSGNSGFCWFLCFVLVVLSRAGLVMRFWD